MPKEYICPRCKKPVFSDEIGSPKIGGKPAHFGCEVMHIRDTRHKPRYSYLKALPIPEIFRFKPTSCEES